MVLVWLFKKPKNESVDEEIAPAVASYLVARKTGRVMT